MGLYDLIISRRSIRRFKPVPIGRPVLEKITNAGRLAPSAANLQPLEFVVVDEAAVCREVFRCLRWANYIAPQGNPRPGEEPTAYIVPVANRLIRDQGYDYDLGAAMESMILAAWDAGIGSCWLLSVDKEKVRGILGLPETYKLDCVLALGYPAESPVVEEFSGSVKYWKDEAGVLHVPKRRLVGVIHFNRFDDRKG
jgi:nitroreductase